MLTAFAMFITLQAYNARSEHGLGLMHDLLPAPLFAFLTPLGDSWDAPIEGEAYAVGPPPGPEVVDLRKRPLAAAALTAASRPRLAEAALPAELEIAGSNNFAVAGRFTAHGVALFADDMHLALGVPNIWYRASVSWPGESGGPPHRATGVTLPGAPTLVVGSNGHVAWGFTNAQADVSDLVLLDDAGNPGSYLTPNSPRRPEVRREVIHVKGGSDQTVKTATTI